MVPQSIDGAGKIVYSSREFDNDIPRRSDGTQAATMGIFDLFKSKVTNTKVDLSKRYALLREAVSGTMSKFYMARDLRTGRVVGLKILDKAKTAAFEDRYRGLKKP